MNQKQQPSEKDKLNAKLSLLKKQANHAAEMIGTPQKTKKDREIAKTLLDSLSQQIVDMEARIKALANSK